MLMSQRFQSLQTEIKFAQHVSQIALLFIVRHVCFAHKYTELKKIEKVNKKISKKAALQKEINTMPYHIGSFTKRNKYHTTSYHAIPYHTIPYHTIPYHTIPYHTIPYHTIPYHTMPYHAV